MLIVTVGTNGIKRNLGNERVSRGKFLPQKVMLPLYGKRIESVYKPISSAAKEWGTSVPQTAGAFIMFKWFLGGKSKFQLRRA